MSKPAPKTIPDISKERQFLLSMSIAKWLRTLRLLITYGGVQGMILVVNGLAGFLLVRGMVKEQYAWFTITNSLLATISVLSDSGLSSAMLSIGGRLCDDPCRFAQMMAFSRVLQMKFLAGAVLLVLPMGGWLLSRNGAPWYVILLLSGLVLATSVGAVESVVRGTVNKLQRRVSFILDADLSFCFSRLFVVVLAMLSGLNAVLAIIATTFAQWIQVWRLRRQAKDDPVASGAVHGGWSPEIHRFVRHLFPLILFNCIQAHVATWLLSVFAHAQAVADVGALARVSIIFSFFGLPMAQIVIPIIAKTQEPRRLAHVCLFTLGGFTLAMLLLVGVGINFASQILYILGSGYSHLTQELGWFLGAQALSIVTNVAWGIACARGWIGYNWLQVPLTVMAQLFALHWLDVSKVTHSIAFAAISNIIGLIVILVLIGKGLASTFQKEPLNGPLI